MSTHMFLDESFFTSLVLTYADRGRFSLSYLRRSASSLRASSVRFSFTILDESRDSNVSDTISSPPPFDLASDSGK